MKKEWYCLIKGDELGPLTVEQVRNLISAGTLGLIDQIRKGDGGWRNVSSIPKLKVLVESRESQKPRQKKKKDKKKFLDPTMPTVTWDDDPGSHSKQEEGWSMTKVGLACGGTIIALVLVFMLAPIFRFPALTLPAFLSGEKGVGHPESSLSDFMRSVKVSGDKITYIEDVGVYDIKWKAKYLSCSDIGMLKFEYGEKHGFTLHFVCTGDAIKIWKRIEPGTMVQFQGHLSRDLGSDLYPGVSVVPSFCSFYSGDLEDRPEKEVEAKPNPFQASVKLLSESTQSRRHLHICVDNCYPLTDDASKTELNAKDMVKKWEESNAAIVTRNNSGQITKILYIAPLRIIYSGRLNADVILAMSNPNVGWPKSGRWIAKGASFPSDYWIYRNSNLSNSQLDKLSELKYLETLLICSDRLSENAKSDKRFSHLKLFDIYRPELAPEGLINQLDPPAVTRKIHSKAKGEAEDKKMEHPAGDKQTHSKVSKTETLTPDGDTVPWETPTRLALFVGKSSSSTLKQAEEVARNSNNSSNTATALTRIAMALSDIALSQLKMGNMEQALAILKQAEEVAIKIEDSSRKAAALKRIALAFKSIALTHVDAGDNPLALSTLKQALEIAQKIDDAANKVTVLTGVASAQIEAGEKQQALEILKLAEGAAQKIDLKAFMVTALSDIALVQIKAEEQQLAEVNLKQAETNAWLIENRYGKAGALSEIVSARAEAKEFSQAKELAQKIEEPIMKAGALNSIASALVKEGNKKEALDILKQAIKEVQVIQIEKYKISLQRNIATTLAEAGEKQLATATLKQAMEIALKIDDADSRAWKLILIARTSTEMGDSQKTLEILKQALKVALKVKDDASGKAWNLKNIAMILTKIDENQQALFILKKAMEEALKVEDVSSKTAALQDIAVMLVAEFPPESKRNAPSRLVVGQLKKTFTPRERQLAKQLVNSTRGN